MIPRLNIAHLPTPIEVLPRLSAALNGQHLYVKRDDLTGPAFGGNKIRKLEFLLAQAQAGGARTLITTGAAQSNHCRQTAALAAQMGMKCILVLSGECNQIPSGNLLLDELLDAEIIWSPREERNKIMQEAFDNAWAEGRRPYLIPLGGSNPLGTLGYAFGFDEFYKQQPKMDWIIVASSSGGTQAGLVLGARLVGWQGQILGISIDVSMGNLQQTVAHLASEASELINQKHFFAPDEILVNDDYLGEGYGIMGYMECEAIHLFAQTEGLFLDPVYTGRAAAGLIDLIRNGFFKPDDNILFWHTGGTPALFADVYKPQGRQSG